VALTFLSPFTTFVCCGLLKNFDDIDVDFIINIL
jgi:hypothetical protein